MEKVQAVEMPEINIMPDECAGILLVRSKLVGRSETNTNNLIWKTKLCIIYLKTVTVLQDQWIF